MPEIRLQVEFEDNTFVLAGLPDSFILDVSLLSANKRATYALLWTESLKAQGIENAKFEVTDSKDVMFDKVQQVLIVHHYYVPGTEESTGELEVVNELKIAEIAATHGMLFAKLFTAALQILTNRKAGEAVSVVDPLAAVALGNSSGAGTPTPDSSSAASPQLESTSTGS